MLVRTRFTVPALVLAVFAVSLAACSGGSQAVPSTALSLASLSVSPIDPTVLIGGTIQLEAFGTLPDDSTMDLTEEVVWTSSDDSVATVSSTGLVATLKLGTTTITATEPTTGMSATTTVEVTDLPAVLSYLSVSRGSVVGGSSVEITGTVALTSYPAEDVTVTLASSDPTAASVPDSVVIAAGSSSATFPVTTYAVTKRTRVFITATQVTDGGTYTKRASLRIRVAH